MSEAVIEKQNSGKIVLASLIGFFVTFASVDAYFVYKAISTHTGVIEERSYEKGLAFNERLNLARAQQDMNASVAYDSGALEFVLKDKADRVVQGAVVSVMFIRPAHDGYDFKTVLPYKGQGLYRAKPDLPLSGLWLAQIEAKWNFQGEKQIYQTELSFIHP